MLQRGRASYYKLQHIMEPHESSTPSKREQEKERLARLLDAGKISQRIYDERIARMKSGGSKTSLEKRKLKNMLKKGWIDQAEHDRRLAALEKTGQAPKEWSPGGK